MGVEGGVKTSPMIVKLWHVISANVLVKDQKW